MDSANEVSKVVVYTIDWTAVGVVFAVVLGICGSILGASITGRWAHKSKRYELYFHEKRAAYVNFLAAVSQIEKNWDMERILSPEFNYTANCATLYSSEETTKVIATFLLDSLHWAQFEKMNNPELPYPDIVLVRNCLREELHFADKVYKRRRGSQKQ